jgi:hypothetical protein
MVPDDAQRDFFMAPLDREWLEVRDRILTECHAPSTWLGALAAGRAMLSESGGYAAKELVEAGDLSGWLARGSVEFMVSEMGPAFGVDR